MSGKRTGDDADWARRLGRLRLGAEPLTVQLERRRKTVLALTGVSLGVASLFLAIFIAFGAPVIGLAVAGVLVGPIIASSWAGYDRLKRAVERYESEARGRS